MRSRLLFSASPLALLVAGSALAADLPAPVPAERIDAAFASLPAVSAVNGKFDLSGGVVEDDETFVAAGALSFPLGHPFGLQLDGSGGMLDGEAFAGGAGHLFWRDPSIALAGLYGSYSYFDDGGVDLARVGGEGELYLGRVGVSAIAGYEFGDAGDGFFDIADIDFYPFDDLKLYAGHRYTDAIGHAAAAGLEYQLPLDTGVGVALFGEGRVGEDDYYAAWGGLRLYFGPKKTLIDRHRQDDPPVRLSDDLGALKRVAYQPVEASEPPASPPPPPPP